MFNIFNKKNELEKYSVTDEFKNKDYFLRQLEEVNERIEYIRRKQRKY